jgi:hypothetical protein
LVAIEINGTPPSFLSPKDPNFGSGFLFPFFFFCQYSFFIRESSKHFAIRWKLIRLELVKKFLAERGVMKFYIRRAVVGLVALPLVAGAYVFVYLALTVLGAGNSLELSEIWNNGLLVGFVSALAFTLAKQLNTIVSKLSGE